MMLHLLNTIPLFNRVRTMRAPGSSDDLFVGGLSRAARNERRRIAPRGFGAHRRIARRPIRERVVASSLSGGS
ncbi:hypothetical protein FSB08_12365 [Paraburkholderia sp. JPY432]|nr:hypothetical protein [Paraburkholderia youngii]